MLFKIIHDLVDIPANYYLTLASNRTRSQYSLNFRQIPTSSDCYKFNFFPHWNSLPANMAEAPILVSFKRELSSVPILTIRVRHVSSSNEVLKLCWWGHRVPSCRHWESDWLGTKEWNALNKSALFLNFYQLCFYLSYHVLFFSRCKPPRCNSQVCIMYRKEQKD